MLSFKKLFSKRELSPIEKIEEDHQVSYPKRFKDLISDSSSELIFILPDEEYKVLDSLLEFNVENKLEDVNYLIEHLNSDTHKVNFTKLPFARNLKAGKDKYLVFEIENGQTKERVFLTDNNAIIKELEITDFADLFQGKPSNISLIKSFQLPNGIKYWDESFQLTKSKQPAKEDNLSLELFATYYEFAERKENIAKFEVQCVLSLSGNTHLFSSAYEVENPNIDRSLKHYLDYRLYYYNLSCFIHTLKVFLDKSDYPEDICEFINTKHLFDIAKKILKGVMFEKIV